MACDLSIGRIEECKIGIGGIRNVYFMNYNQDAFTLNADDEVTGFPVGSTVYKYELKGTNNGFNQTVNTSRDNGTTFFAQEVVMNMKKLDAATTKEFKLMAYGRPKLIVQTNDGKSFLVGKDNGADITAGTISSGQAFGDFVGYSATFTANEFLPACHISGSTIDDPFAAITNPPTVVTG